METLEATSTTRAGNSSRSVAIEFLSQITNTRTRIRNVRTYIYTHMLVDAKKIKNKKVAGQLKTAPLNRTRRPRIQNHNALGPQHLKLIERARTNRGNRVVYFNYNFGKY